MATFQLTADHIALLRRAYVSWWDCETGAPAMDCKRPYGNSDVAGDICEILGWEGDPLEDKDLHTRCMAIHREMETALQIVMRNTGINVCGAYERDCGWSPSVWLKSDQEPQP